MILRMAVTMGPYQWQRGHSTVFVGHSLWVSAYSDPEPTIPHVSPEPPSPPTGGVAFSL